MQNSPVKELLKRGMQASLDEHQVPLHMHLKVVEALSDAMHEHKKDRENYRQIVLSHAQALQVAHHKIGEYQQEVARLHTLPHIKGEPGSPGRSVQGISGKDGKDGKTPDVAKIIASVRAQIRQPKDGESGKDASFDKEALKREVVQFLRESKSLDISDIRNAQSFMFNGKKYKTEELMRGAGGSAGSLSGTQEKSTTVPNGVLTTFAFAHTPKVIVWNGAIQTLTDDYTVSGNNITFTVSAGVPLTGDKILNIYA